MIKKRADDYWTIVRYCPAQLTFIWKLIYKFNGYKVDIRDYD